MVNHSHLSSPLITPRGVWQGLDEAPRGRASSEGLDWTDAKVSPRPEIPAFCEKTDTPTFTISPVATLVSRNLANGSRTMSQARLLHFQNFKHSQTNWRSQTSCPSSPLNAGGRVSPSFLLPITTLHAVPSSRGARLSHQPHG